MKNKRYKIEKVAYSWELATILERPHNNGKDNK